MWYDNKIKFGHFGKYMLTEEYYSFNIIESLQKPCFILNFVNFEK